MNRLSLVVTVIAFVSVVESTQAQDIYDNPALQGIAPLLRQTEKTIQDTNRALLEMMPPQQRQDYENCVAQGGWHDTCVFLAQQNQQSTQTQDIYDHPVLREIALLMRQTEKTIQDTNRALFQMMTPQQRQEYDNCMAQGVGHENCMFMARQNQQMRNFEWERSEADRLAQGCYQNNDQQACEQLNRLMASIENRAAAAELQTQVFTHQQRVEQQAKEAQQRIWDSEAASEYRMQAWRYGEAAKQAYARGDRYEGDRLRYEAEQQQMKANEYAPNR